MTEQVEKAQAEQVEITPEQPPVTEATEVEQSTNEETTANAEETVVDPLAQALARVQELETYIAEADKREQDITLRARAEIENMRRRTEQDVEKAHKFSLEKFAKELLSVVDNLERGLQALANAGESVKPLVEGVEMTHKELISTLTKFGVEAVGNVGEEFNPELHQAISMQPAENIEPNHLSNVLQKGYTLHGRVIRPAMVMVAS